MLYTVEWELAGEGVCRVRMYEKYLDALHDFRRLLKRQREGWISLESLTMRLQYVKPEPLND